MKRSHHEESHEGKLDEMFHSVLWVPLVIPTCSEIDTLRPAISWITSPGAARFDAAEAAVMPVIACEFVRLFMANLMRVGDRFERPPIV